MQKKRWYQLSMLQMLVVMAVVAFFVITNKDYDRLQQNELEQPNISPNIRRIDVLTYRRGWPFTFHRIQMYRPAKSEKSPTTSFNQFEWERNNWIAFAGNLSLHLFLLVVTTKAMQNFPGPSPIDRHPKNMATPKRWYQLSMLQLLVAMAVGSLLIILNSPNHRDQTAVLQAGVTLM